MKRDDIKDLYPFESHYLDIDGLKYHYLDEGKGDVMLMVHGNPTWSFFYRDLVKNYSKNYRVIAVDHIGCGLSDKPQDYAYVLENHISNLMRLINHLSLKNITLFVHDWGGAIGFGCATRRKDLFKRFVVFNTAAFVSSDIPFRISLCRLPGVGKVAVRAFNAFAGAATFMTTVDKLPKKVKDGFIFPYDNWKNRIATHEFVRDIPLEMSHPSRDCLQAVDDGLAALTDIPMIICWRKHDWCFNMDFLKTWKERFPKAPVHELEAGHYLIEDKGTEIISLVDSFLEKNK